MKIKLAVLVGTLLAPIALVMILAKANRKKEERYKQWMNPLIALAFTVLCCIFFSKLTQAVDWLLKQPFMASVSQWIQQITSSTLKYGVKLYGAYLLNMGVLIGYFFFKNTYQGLFALTAKVIRFFKRLVAGKKAGEDGPGKEKKRVSEAPIPEDIGKLKGPARLYWEIMDRFYHMHDRTGLVRENWLAAGKIALYAFCILGGVYLLLIGFAQLPLLAGISWYPYDLMSRWMDSCYLWPAISAVAILECVFFLGGKEKYDIPKLAPAPEAPPEEEAPEADYSQLQETYEKLFEDRFVKALKVPGYPRQQEEPAPRTELAQGIYDRLLAWKSENRRSLDKAVLDCITALPDRENAVIDAQLSADFGECLMLYMNVLLARGENVLVLCRDEETCEDIRRYVDQALRRINALTPVWMVRSVREAYQNSDCDVLVLPPDAVMSKTVRSAHQRFFRGLTTVLMIDVSRLIAEMGTLLMAAASRLAMDGDRQLQYIALCNGMPNELRATLEQSISPGREFRAFECFSSAETSRIMLWNYEPSGEGKVITAQSRLLHQAMDRVYLGVAVPLACVALKNGVESVSVLGGRIPEVELREAMRLGFSQMNNYFSGALTADELSARLLFREIDARDPFVIVVDDTYNLPMTIRNNCRYIGSSCAMVHVVSKPYMLRDYFADHAADYLLDKAKMEMFAAILRDSNKTAALRLIFETSKNEGLSESRLMQQMQKMGCPAVSLRDALEKCYAIACNGEAADAIENYFAVKTHSSFRRRDNKFIYQRYVTLKDDTLLARLIGDILPARLQVGEEEIRLGIPQGDVYRYYLPDQAIVVNDRMYYIDSVEGREGLLRAGRKIETLDLAVDYTQHRHYTLGTESMRTERRVSQEISLGGADERRADRFEAELLRDVSITVDTLGYLAPHPSYPRLDLTSRAQYRELDPWVRQDARRTIPRGSALAVRFKGVDPGEADKTAITLAVLFSELMKTLFPYNWPCIAVCPVLHGPVEDGEEQVSFERLAMAYPQVTCPETWPLEPDTAEILILEDSQKDLGVLDALFRNRQRPLSAAFTLLREYLEWQRTFEEKENSNIRSDYLKFGGEELPGYFNLRYTEDMMRQMEVTHPVGEEDDPFLKSNACYFCHANLLVTDYIVLRDEYGKKDRKVCTDCAKLLLNKKEDLMPLFEQAKAYLCDTYHITLNPKTNVKFTSAATIRRQLNRNRKHRRIVGLAQSLTKTVWVETNSPKEFILRTLVHELTHIWQFDHIRTDDIVAMEGHTSYMEVRYMHDLGYFKLEQETDSDLRSRTDEYGTGYVRMAEAMENRADGDPFAYMAETYPKASRGKKGKKARPEE